MKKIKLLKTLLISTLGVSSIGAIAAVSTSCSPVVIVTGVSLNKESLPLGIGDSDTLIATVLPENATDKSVIWSSSDSSVATVDNNGKVTAVSEGQATITVTTNDGGFTATCKVTVHQEMIHVIGVWLNKESLALGIGNTETLTATVLPADATDKSVTWSSSDSSVATVNSHGTITAVAEGTATITVKTNDGGFADTCQVIVQILVTSVSLDKKSLTLETGDSDTLIATVHPDDASDKSVTWRSSNSSVAIVDNNGKVTAVGDGSAKIIVKTNDGGYEDYCNVTVNSPYICVTANEDSTLELINIGDNNPNLYYSFDGKNWTTYSKEINILANKKIYLKGYNPSGWSQSLYNYSTLAITQGAVSIFGNVMALLDNGVKRGETGDIVDIPNQYCFVKLFYCSSGIKSISNNFLPSTSLTSYCYSNMFDGCSSLTTAPDLPATKLADNCYSFMFQNCKSLIAAPDLPATILANHCYFNMFSFCSSLTTAPALPATELEPNCYQCMFYWCSYLATAPDLPATKLADNCYEHMFALCESLTTVPELPAINLADACYANMFVSCWSIKSIKIGYNGNYTDRYFDNWVNGVPSSGTFYYNGSQTAQDFQLPSGWTTIPFNLK